MLCDEEVRALAAVAASARTHAYAPYSGYSVGAAVVTDDGRVFAGCNVENASLGLSLCAERSAIAAAVSHGAKRVAAVVVVTDCDPPETPCGACRQWLNEMAGPDAEVVLCNPTGAIRRFKLSDLLPHAFGAQANT